MLLKLKDSLAKMFIFFKPEKQRFNFKSPFSLLALFLFVAVIASFPIHEAKAGAFDFISFDLFSIFENFFTGLIVSDNFVMKFFNFFAYQIYNILLLLITILVYFSAWLVDVFLDPAIYTAVFDVSTPGTAVNIGWTTVRDFCNLFFVLFLLVIAFATILRVQAYNAKNILPKFIISIFLINFSASIAMLIIDFGQVLMYEIITWMGAGGFGTAGSGLTSIVDFFNTQYNLIPPETEAGRYTFDKVIGVGFAVTYSAFLVLIYIMLSVFLLIRLIALAILIILSPFAFFSMIFPGMRKHTTEWFSSLIKNTLFGPVFLFFIFLSTVMATTLRTTYTIPPNIPDKADGLSVIAAVFIPHVISLCFLLAAPLVANKLGMYGASKIVGGRLGLGNVGMGAVGAIKKGWGGGKWAGRRAKTAHTIVKTQSGKYRNIVSNTMDKLKGTRILGKYIILNESEKAESRKEKVNDAEKALDNRTVKERKQVIADTIGPEAKADYIEATFNRLGTKEHAYDLNEKELIKGGFKNEDGSLDRDEIKKLFNTARATNRDMEKAEKVMPFTVEDKEKRYEMFDKMIEKDEISETKAEHFVDGDEEYLRGKMGDKDYEDLFMKKKSQPEKDAYGKKKEEKLATMINEEGNAKPGMENEVTKLRVEIARLASSNMKLDKLRKVEVKNGKVEFVGGFDHDIAKKSIEKMTPAEIGRQNKDFHINFAYHYDAKQVDGVFKDRDSSAEVKISMEDSIYARLKKISENGKGKKAKKGEEEEFDLLTANLKKIGSRITRVTDKKKEKE